MILFLYWVLLLFLPTDSLNISDQVCNEKMIFVLDSSSSVNNEELFGKQHTYKKFKTEISNIINSNNITGSNIGLLSFDNKPDIIIKFNSSLDINGVIDKIRRLKYHRKSKHTNLELALEAIEQRFIIGNFNIIKIFFFTDTQIGNEFIQPDHNHYISIKKRFNNYYWNNDYIEKYIYYDGNQINQSVLDLFSKEKQFRINNQSFRSDCYKQKCLDKYCIKKPEEYHKICINSSNVFQMYNTHCHYLCSNRDLKFLNNKLELDKCYTNITYTPNIHNVTYIKNMLNKTIEEFVSTSTPTSTPTPTPIPTSTPIPISTPISTPIPISTPTSTPTSTNIPNKTNLLGVNRTVSSTPKQYNMTSKQERFNRILLLLILIVVLLFIILLVLVYLKFRKNKKNKENILVQETSNSYSNRLFNNAIYNIDL